MENLVNKLKAKYAKEIKLYGISEIFVLNGELYTTSNYALMPDFIEQLEKELL